MERPLVTCVTPTYGRGRELSEAVECFLRQTYTPRELLICNDAPVAIEDVVCAESEDVFVTVLNRPLFETLGHKYNFMLEMAQGEIIAHWEDDDLFLPDHLEKTVAALLESNVACVKSSLAHVMDCDTSGEWRYCGVQGNWFESQMVFWMASAIAIGGYGLDNKQHSTTLLRRFGDAYIDRGKGNIYDPQHLTYVFRWDTRLFHGQCSNDPAAWRAAHTDFRGAIMPSPVQQYFDMIPGTVNA
jgi:glycosyltransferase involved in cell wall biosynthesis